MFYNDIDNAIHNLDDAGRVAAASKELKNIMDYGIKRGYDVVLLFDHGFIEVEEKILRRANEKQLKRKKVDICYYLRTIK